MSCNCYLLFQSRLYYVFRLSISLRMTAKIFVDSFICWNSNEQNEFVFVVQMNDWRNVFVVALYYLRMTRVFTMKFCSRWRNMLRVKTDRLVYINTTISLCVKSAERTIDKLTIRLPVPTNCLLSLCIFSPFARNSYVVYTTFSVVVSTAAGAHE